MDNLSDEEKVKIKIDSDDEGIPKLREDITHIIISIANYLVELIEKIFKLDLAYRKNRDANKNKKNSE